MSGGDDLTDEETGFHLQGLPQSDESRDLRAREPFELLVSQFVEQLRTGLRPSVELFARRFPPHAAKIREVFPILAALETARIEREARTIRQHMPDRFPFTRLGNCELIRELGRGGMGVVCQARDLETQDIVAIKILPWRVSIAPDQVARFAREARIASQLNHPNIVPVIRYGQENGYCFIVMKFINGLGLDRVIDQLRRQGRVTVGDVLATGHHESTGEFTSSAQRAESGAPSPHMELMTRSSWQRFADIAEQTANALSFAHAAGILHNDIKPGNLLLDDRGHMWVTDFGLSRTAAEIGTAESEATISGTLRYMSPERLNGVQSVACDLYAFGAALYELCLQQPLYAEAEREAMVRIVRATRPVRPRSVRPDLPRGLEMIILNCLAHSSADRYTSAMDLLTDLHRFERNQPVRSRRRSPVRRAIDWLRRAAGQ